ncbi:GNAT family N-acetyltransferase [Xanthovirga aplysinae]|uniref:GNAT family N-acetyltransferase n=1 Tax=Xanthovirga aplysinae TaxID=2529853 RepID=UPI0012BCE4BA|nr:GNAT family N-acetyltransferase [Xanthovirga aplysinae]MTI31918.1 N-acetyltransferase [Xanthovirga aplysinae]
MKEPIVYRSIEPEDLPKMYGAFKRVYADFPAPFFLHQEMYLKKYIARQNIDYKLSVGAFEDDKLIGFILSSVALYEGKLTAFNNSEGFLPVHRKEEVSVKMYDFLRPLLQKAEVKQCLIEVQTNDKKLLKVAKKLGFKANKTYHCLILSNQQILASQPPGGISIRIQDKADWDFYESFTDVNAPFLNSRYHLDNNEYDEMVISAKKSGEDIGFAIFEPDMGRVAQIGVRRDFRRRGVGSALLSFIYQLSANKSLLVNVDTKAKDVNEYFKEMGFETIGELAEMKLIL